MIVKIGKVFVKRHLVIFRGFILVCQAQKDDTQEKGASLQIFFWGFFLVVGQIFTRQLGSKFFWVKKWTKSLVSVYIVCLALRSRQLNQLDGGSHCSDKYACAKTQRVLQQCVSGILRE